MVSFPFKKDFLTMLKDSFIKPILLTNLTIDLRNKISKKAKIININPSRRKKLESGSFIKNLKIFENTIVEKPRKIINPIRRSKINKPRIYDLSLIFEESA